MIAWQPEDISRRYQSKMQGHEQEDQQQQLQGKKRRRSDDALTKAYEGVTYTPIVSTGRPGTPHCYFRESYEVDLGNHEDEPKQVAHVHVNGLVVVTAGNSSWTSQGIESVDVLVKVADVASQSAGNKRKQKAKMLKGKNVNDAVFPKDKLAVIRTKDGKEVQSRCCAWGSVIEINPNLSPNLLQQDPLLDGYLAVILPSGPFPPSSCTKEDSDSQPRNGLADESASS